MTYRLLLINRYNCVNIPKYNDKCELKKKPARLILHSRLILNRKLVKICLILRLRF